ncbi:hypothetical protein AURDEDRAFT_130540 [Auricularia subglabra TFB-10046 SS5]|nr:hypothetical protein AURDEDRAFT_130540 [Auricularia subglabra TFB-10046 SS5]
MSLRFNVRGLRAERVRADEAALSQIKARLEQLAGERAAADALLVEAKRAVEDVARETVQLQDVERKMAAKLELSRAALIQDCISTLPDDVLRCIFSEAVSRWQTATFRLPDGVKRSTLDFLSRSVQELFLGIRLGTNAAIPPICFPLLRELFVSPASTAIVRTPLSSFITAPVLQHLELRRRPAEIDGISPFLDAVSATVRRLTLFTALTGPCLMVVARLRHLEELTFYEHMTDLSIRDDALELLSTSDPRIWPELTRIKNASYTGGRAWSSEAIFRFIASRNPAKADIGHDEDNAMRPSRLLEFGFDKHSSPWLVNEVKRLLELILCSPESHKANLTLSEVNARNGYKAQRAGQEKSVSQWTSATLDQCGFIQSANAVLAQIQALMDAARQRLGQDETNALPLDPDAKEVLTRSAQELEDLAENLIGAKEEARLELWAHYAAHLPEDIWRCVFEHAALATSSGRAKTPLALASVCSRWRCIALSSPRMWSYISLRLEERHPAEQQLAQLTAQLELAQLMLARSAACPLSVSIFWFYVQPPDAAVLQLMGNVLAAVAQHASRWSDATLVFPGGVQRRPGSGRNRYGMFDCFPAAEAIGPTVRCLTLFDAFTPAPLRALQLLRNVESVDIHALTLDEGAFVTLADSVPPIWPKLTRMVATRFDGASWTSNGLLRLVASRNPQSTGEPAGDAARPCRRLREVIVGRDVPATMIAEIARLLAD